MNSIARCVTNKELNYLPFKERATAVVGYPLAAAQLTRDLLMVIMMEATAPVMGEVTTTSMAMAMEEGLDDSAWGDEHLQTALRLVVSQGQAEDLVLGVTFNPADCMTRL